MNLSATRPAAPSKSRSPLGGLGSLWRPPVVAATLLLTACTPAAPPAQPTSAPASSAPTVKPQTALSPQPAASPQGAASPKAASPVAGGPLTRAASEEWTRVLAAARQEGVVNCGCPPRPDFSRILKEGFEAAYPGIRLEVTAAPLPEFPVRVSKEQQAGQYLWDVYMFGPSSDVFDLKNAGGFESLRDYMVGPDIGDDTVWEGGIDRGFLDREKKYVFGFWHNVSGRLAINRDVLPNLKLEKYQDLFAPELKGKMVWVDPRIGGTGAFVIANVYRQHGEAGMRTLLQQQDPLLVRGNIEAAEQIARGARPIAIPQLSRDAYLQFVQAGVKLNIEEVGGPELMYSSAGGSSPAVFKQPPHPNAVKVFLNWVLSRDGQARLAKELVQNSARKDVAPGDPPNLPQPGVSYWPSQAEASQDEVVRPAQRLARELLP